MPIISGGGGAAFNGGTITTGLEIDNPSNSLNALTIKEMIGSTVDTIGPGGELHIAADYSQANDIWALRVDPGNNGSAEGLEVRNQGGASRVWYTDNNGDIESAGISIAFSNGAAAITALADAQTPLTLRPHAAADSSLVLLNTTGSTVAAVSAAGVVTQKGTATNAILSGALPTATLSSGTGAQVSTTRDVETFTPVTFNPGVATTATCTIALSPDNVTYSTLGVETEPAGTAFDGTIHVLRVRVPAGWYIKLTVNAQATLGTTTYY